MVESGDGGDELQLLHGRHAKFLKRTLDVLPSSLCSYDTQRVTIAYFAVSGLDLLDRLDLVRDQLPAITGWLYSCLVSPRPGHTEHLSPALLAQCGFRGSPAFKLPSCSNLPSHAWDHGHIAMTYTALSSLLVLGDDLGRVDRVALAAGIRALQLPDGSFRAALEGGENDMRFLYCAAAICYMLDCWEGMDTEAAFGYVISSFSFEGGVGQGPGLEAHGGSTFCAVAALSLMGRLGELGSERLTGLERWCVMRQAEGFMGRPNKPEDTCYSFWVGATLKLLSRLELCDWPASRRFVLSTQDPVTGGLAKWADTQPDPLHTYLGLSGLALQGEPGLRALQPALNISQRAAEWLHSVQQTWT